MLFARESSIKYGIGDILEHEASGAPLVGYNKKQNQRVVDPTLEETWPDHAIRSSVAITKLSLGRDIEEDEEKEEQQKGEMQFF